MHWKWSKTKKKWKNDILVDSNWYLDLSLNPSKTNLRFWVFFHVSKLSFKLVALWSEIAWFSPSFQIKIRYYRSYICLFFFALHTYYWLMLSGGMVSTTKDSFTTLLGAQKSKMTRPRTSNHLQNWQSSSASADNNIRGQQGQKQLNAKNVTLPTLEPCPAAALNQADSQSDKSSFKFTREFQNHKFYKPVTIAWPVIDMIVSFPSTSLVFIAVFLLKFCARHASVKFFFYFYKFNLAKIWKWIDFDRITLESNSF